jgi:hypothetical protein
LSQQVPGLGAEVAPDLREMDKLGSHRPHRHAGRRQVVQELLTAGRGERRRAAEDEHGETGSFPNIRRPVKGRKQRCARVDRPAWPADFRMAMVFVTVSF